jgi:hypothetical protein
VRLRRTTPEKKSRTRTRTMARRRLVDRFGPKEISVRSDKAPSSQSFLKSYSYSYSYSSSSLDSGFSETTYCESGASSASEDTVKPTPEQARQRFENYELVTGENGKPVELGRGAMGVTYKAFDVDLHFPVALKVIREHCSIRTSESSRLRRRRWRKRSHWRSR